MTHPNRTYCLAFPLTDNFKRVLRKYRGGYGIAHLGIHALLYIPRDDGVKRLGPKQFQQFIDGDQQSL